MIGLNITFLLTYFLAMAIKELCIGTNKGLLYLSFWNQNLRYPERVYTSSEDTKLTRACYYRGLHIIIAIEYHLT